MRNKILTTHNGVFWHYHVSSRGYRERRFEIRLTDWVWQNLHESFHAKQA